MKKSNKTGQVIHTKILLFCASAMAGALLFLSIFPMGVQGGKTSKIDKGIQGVFQAKSEVYSREKLASYTTYFNQNEGGRCENIRLAAARLDGIALQPYGQLSFNALVGKRTKENGYKMAKIISKGEFINGIGGGVCQVSTTLYNAAVLSGLTATEFHAHSMRVGYVPLSQDAMVSSHHDLRLYNPRRETVYFSVTVGSGYIRCTIYGTPNGRTYAVESKTIEELPAPPPKTEMGERDETLRQGQSGWKSESYLKTYERGVLVSVQRLRVDEYAPQQGIVRKKAEKMKKTTETD